MLIRRVVTSHDKDGRAVVASDGSPPWSKEFEHTPGFASTLAWLTDAPPRLPFDGNDPTPHVKTFVPPAGGSRFIIVTFPPDSVFARPDFDFAASAREHAEQSPGLVDHFEPDNPGMHTTPTVDYGIVLDGEIWLELDDGKTVHLTRHNVVIQNGTRHAWRNKGQAPATMAFVLMGAAR
jgi:hypothetical protein